MIRFISESEQPCDVFRNRIELTKTDNAIKRLIAASCVIKLPLTFSIRSNEYMIRQYKDNNATNIYFLIRSFNSELIFFFFSF